jgi:hypothetical protein
LERPRSTEGLIGKAEELSLDPVFFSSLIYVFLGLADDLSVVSMRIDNCAVTDRVTM